MFQRISNSMKMAWFSFAVAVSFMSGIVAADSRKPNIIYIMADDKCQDVEPGKCGNPPICVAVQEHPLRRPAIPAVESRVSYEDKLRHRRM